jgi:flagellar hook-basal body complex protein FliE
MTPISLNNAFGGGLSSELLNLRAQSLAGKGKGISGPEIHEPSALPLPATPSQGQSVAGFDNLLGKFVNEVNAKQMAAGDAVTGVLSGQNIPLHQAMIAMEEASVSFQLMVEVRNKLLEGYQELMRMQV